MHCCLTVKKMIHSKKLEEQPRVQTVVQPAVVSEEIESLKSKVLDLQCRSMKNNLVFSGLSSNKFENCENKLKDFIRHELRIDHYIEFGNVHRFGKPGRNGARPIVARFIVSITKLLLISTF
jgi:hypothetical protein